VERGDGIDFLKFIKTHLRPCLWGLKKNERIEEAMNKSVFQFLLLFLTAPLFSQNLYDLSHIVEIKITFNVQGWSEKLDSLKRAGSKNRLPATIQIDGRKFEEVGVRFKGNSSYFNPRKAGSTKLPFNIKANFKIKKQRFPGGYQTLKLSNVFRDPSFLREVLSYEIARKYMPAPLCNFAKLYVNDQYLGLYNNSESVNEQFLDKHFGNHKGAFFKCDPNWNATTSDRCPEGDKASLMYLGDDPACYSGLYELKSKDEKAWDELIDLTKILNEKPGKIQEVLDVDRVLWMHAFNIVLANLDSYTGRLCHNYYLYKSSDSLFTPIVWDMNLSFGGFRFDGLTKRMLDNKDLEKISPFVHFKTRNAKRPLIVKLLENPLYRKIYIGHLRTILYENFVNGEYLKRAKEVQELIGNEVEMDANKLYDNQKFHKNLAQTVAAGRSKIIGIEELMTARTDYLSNHPLLAIAPPSISKVEHLHYGPTVAINAVVEGAQRAFLAYRYGKKESFRFLEMFDDSGHNDQMKGDGIWGATIENKAGIQYYIIAEGERLAMLSPKRASFEFYEVK